jgi:hypothetical protein
MDGGPLWMAVASAASAAAGFCAGRRYEYARDDPLRARLIPCPFPPGKCFPCRRLALARSNLATLHMEVHAAHEA